MRAETLKLSVSWYARLLQHCSRCFRSVLHGSYRLDSTSCLSFWVGLFAGSEFQENIASSLGSLGRERPWSLVRGSVGRNKGDLNLTMTLKYSIPSLNGIYSCLLSSLWQELGCICRLGIITILLLFFHS